MIDTSLFSLIKDKKFEYNELELSHPTTGIISITNRCNLSCPYCFHIQSDYDMNFETADMAARFLLMNAAISKRKPEINFFGGEPLLCFHTIIVPLINKYGDSFSWGITTNGTLLDEGIIDWLYKHKVNILLSIDGCKTIQDNQRPMQNRQSSYDILQKIIPYLLIKYPQTTFRSTLTHNSLQYLEENLNTIETFGFQNYTLVPNLFENWEHNDYLKWRNYIDDQAIKIMQYISLNKPLKTNFNNLIQGTKSVFQLNKIEEIKSPLDKCGMGIKGIGISPDGSLHPCQEENGLNEINNIGNVKQNLNIEQHKQYCENLYNKWLKYIKNIDQLPTSLNFKLFYANSYCSTRLKDDFAFNSTQTQFLKAIHQSCVRLFFNYNYTYNEKAKKYFNIGEEL